MTSSTASPSKPSASLTSSAKKWAIGSTKSAGARSSSAGRSPRIRRSSTKKATNKGKRTSTQTHRLTGYGSRVSDTSHQGIQGHGVEAPTGTDRTLWPVDGLPLRSPRSYLGSSGQARHPEQKPRCVESAENMYRQYQRKLAETVKDKYVPRAAHFAALKRSSTERNSHASGLRSTANGTSREGIHAILERAKNRP